MNHAIPYNAQCEMMAREELEQIQTERLQVTLNRVYRSVAFYRMAFDTHQVNLQKFKDIRALRDLPFTTKEDLQKSYPYNMFAVPLRDIVRIHATSGTTVKGSPTAGSAVTGPKPIVVGYTQNDLISWRQCAARLLAAAGVAKGDVGRLSAGRRAARGLGDSRFPGHRRGEAARRHAGLQDLRPDFDTEPRPGRRGRPR
jgi:phenylacetate-CoA ligase